MNKMQPQTYGYYSADTCSLSAFEKLVLRDVDLAEIPLAAGAARNVPLYDMSQRAGMLEDPEDRQKLMAEWARVLLQGAGVFVLKSAYADTDAIDTATEIFNQIIAAEKEQSGGGADHFATAGANDRIWNTLQKLCMADPETYVRYHANPAIDAACEAWLGPNYQITAQVNVVHPGGQAQQAHRDYHLGFQTAGISACYPAHVHELSPLMTLQGGIAHCDMPLESGPTKLLPFSQLYRPGYAAWRRDDFRAFFEEHYVQIPLEKGDALFFNPALFHAAGANSTENIHRMANLLQISSAFGRAMETLDRTAMCRASFDAFKRLRATGEKTDAALDAAINATAEGYSFPTNLDRDPPIGGLAPKTQKTLLREAITEDWTAEALSEALAAQDTRKIA